MQSMELRLKRGRLFLSAVIRKDWPDWECSKGRWEKGISDIVMWFSGIVLDYCTRVTVAPRIGFTVYSNIHMVSMVGCEPYLDKLVVGMELDDDYSTLREDESKIEEDSPDRDQTYFKAKPERAYFASLQQIQLIVGDCGTGPFEGQMAVLYGLQKAVHLNGQFVRVQTYIEDKQRYKCVLIRDPKDTKPRTKRYMGVRSQNLRIKCEYHEIDGNLKP